MKKLYFVLTALLLAAPAFCDINVACSADGNEVTVTYATTDSNLPRAFGLDISLSGGANIVAVTYSDPNFWVHPGTIVIVDGDVNDPGTPVAPYSEPGRELEGLGTDGMTIEMGSLYDANDANHPTEPAGSGTLLKFTVDSNCYVTIGGNAARGNVVLEDTTEATANYSTCEVPEDLECYTGPDYAEWVLRGKPSCWCNPRQCHGDAANDKAGTAKKGYYYVGNTDLGILAAGWKVLEPPDGSGILGKDSGGILLTCGDTAHDKAGTAKKGYYYVGNTDLGRVAAYWKALEPPDGSGTPADCNP
jgi:hypothetical protein